MRKAVLFGSYGRASATEKSDVDLLVESNLRGLQFIGLTEYIRIALHKEVDLFVISRSAVQVRSEAPKGH